MFPSVRQSVPMYKYWYLLFSSTIRTFIDCVDFSSCNREEQLVGRSFIDALSFSKCGYEQSDSLFERYGGPPSC